MRYFYSEPSPELQGLVGSYYLMDMPMAASDLVRVEIPHIRVLCRGYSILSVGDVRQRFDAPAILVCGPGFTTGSVEVGNDTLIIGASLMPAGWHRIVGRSAAELADCKVDIGEVRPDLETGPLLRHLAETQCDADRFRAVGAFLTEAAQTDVAVRDDFLTPALDWVSDPDSPGVASLIEATGLSARQVDRLCRFYFGGSPKKVHRVFRALNVAHRLAMENVTDWREVADGYFDQSHLIRDFRDRIGCTPGVFMKERRMMMRFDIELRQKVTGLSRYCLIG